LIRDAREGRGIKQSFVADALKVSGPAEPKPRKDPPSTTIKAAVVVSAPAPVEPKPAPLMVVIQTDPIAFTDARGCRWPLWDPAARLGDKSVCGASCGTNTYCAGHARLAYCESERRAA
jgi:hypothetical protein